MEKKQEHLVSYPRKKKKNLVHVQPQQTEQMLCRWCDFWGIERQKNKNASWLRAFPSLMGKEKASSKLQHVLHGWSKHTNILHDSPSSSFPRLSWEHRVVLFLTQQGSGVQWLDRLWHGLSEQPELRGERRSIPAQRSGETFCLHLDTYFEKHCTKSYTGSSQDFVPT